MLRWAWIAGERPPRSSDPGFERLHDPLRAAGAVRDEDERRRREIRTITDGSPQPDAVEARHVPLGNDHPHRLQSQSRERPGSVGLTEDPVWGALQHGAGRSGTVT